MAPRQTKQGALEEINEILKAGLRPMLDLAPIFEHFEKEVQRHRDQAELAKASLRRAQEDNATLHDKLEQATRERDAARTVLSQSDERVVALEFEVQELRQQVADPQGLRHGGLVSSLLELDPV